MNTVSFLNELDPACLEVASRAPGPAGRLPLTEELLREAPSGDLFGWTQNAGMGWNGTIQVDVYGPARTSDTVACTGAPAARKAAKRSPWKTDLKCW